ncbi:unnamed protein product [Effrenium voratum]|nr:unnamed protein product [Effrenium voratum]
MARPPLPRRPQRGEDEIQALLDECDRVQRNWDHPDSGKASNGTRAKQKGGGKGKSAKGSGSGQIHDMLSWALARHQALEEEKQEQSLSAESANMADALQEAKNALADAKLRIRVAEASEREKIRAQLEAHPTALPSDLESQCPSAEDKSVAEPEPKMEVEAREKADDSKQGRCDESGQIAGAVAPPRPPRGLDAAARPRWKVVGGVGKGGIIVRAGCDLHSEQLAERLSTGAVVEEAELVGDRLRYWRVSGSGPASGWVSLRMAQKELLVKMAPSGPLVRPVWRSDLAPKLGMPSRRRSNSAYGERPALPPLPQPKSAPPVQRPKADLHLPPLPPLSSHRSMNQA